MKFLDIDGPLIQFLSRMADLMWLNILTMICCIPIVTAGASLTALNYMALKMVRNEEGYITRGFFKAFKENFRQSTVIWLLFLLVAAVLGADYRILKTTDIEIDGIVRTLILLFGILTVFTLMFVFPVQAKFSNTVKRTIWNSFVFSVVQFPKTILMIILYALPYVILYFSLRVLPVVFVFSLSLPAFASAKLYNKLFLRLEEQILAQSGENEEIGEADAAEADGTIFRDDLEETAELSQNH
ncbi:MAG: DUF624 domain-containing protein [Muribaculum sp.]|nr:DUF624 domain-containing protein [Muribaculum sp.]